MRPGENIAVFLPNWVGDVVMATPALRALREHFNSARITYIGRQAPLAALSGAPWADDVMPDLSRQRPGAANFPAQVARLRRRRFDLAVLLPNSFRSALLARLAGVRRIAGYDRQHRGWMLTDKLPAARQADGGFLPMSAVRYYMDLLGVLGVDCPAAGRLELAVTDFEARAADEILDRALPRRGGPIVMLNPGASFGTSKMWDPSRYAELADLLVRRRRARIIINAAPSEREIAAEVGRAMETRPAVNFADRDNTLGLLKGLLRRCALLVTNDTGARHVAAALGIGVVTLFGSTDPRWSEIDCAWERIVRVDVRCSPCQSKLCLQPAGPTYHQCMSAITADMVLAACGEVLDLVARGKKGAAP